MMQIAGLSMLHQRPDAEMRLTVAVVASLLLHALMLMSLSAVSSADKGFSWPVQAPLSVLIEKPMPVQQAKPAAHIEKPVARSATKALPAQRPEQVPTVPPATSGADLPRYPSQPGVTVSELLYQGSIPARVTSPLLLDEDYRSASEVSEQPAALAVKVPKYPLSAQQQKLSGWVIVLLFLDENGKVVDSVAVTSSESFSEYEGIVAAELQGSFYAPGKLGDRAVKTRLFAKVHFDSGALRETSVGVPLAQED